MFRLPTAAWETNSKHWFTTSFLQTAAITGYAIKNKIIKKKQNDASVLKQDPKIVLWFDKGDFPDNLYTVSVLK